jgi:hypothetical protein
MFPPFPKRHRGEPWCCTVSVPDVRPDHVVHAQDLNDGTLATFTNDLQINFDPAHMNSNALALHTVK